jgi:hypothetical protein
MIQRLSNESLVGARFIVPVLLGRANQHAPVRLSFFSAFVLTIARLTQLA